MSALAFVALGEVAEFVRGINFKPDDVVLLGTEGAVACMRTKNVQTELDMNDVWAVSESFVRRDDQFLRRGDVLVSSANSWNLVGKCSWIPELPWRASFGGFVSVLRGQPSSVDARYLYHWFASEYTQTLLRSFGQKTTNISNLNTERALALKFPLPPLEEQRRIAAILDQAETLRAQRRAAIAQLDSLGQAIFVEMFGDAERNPLGWKRGRLGDVAVQGFQNGLYKPASEYGSGNKILRIDAFYDGAVTDLGKLKRVGLTKGEVELYGLQEGDIVINRVNSMEYLGKSAVIPAMSEPVVFESNMMRFTPDTAVALSGYLIAFLQTAFIKKQIATAAKQAVNQASINQKDVAGFQINLPSLSLQSQFADRIDRLQAIKLDQQRSMAEFGALFASLQHRAFRGELTRAAA